MNLSPDEIYDKLISSGLSEEQIENEIKSKEQTYRGYISKEGSLFLVAKDHNLIIEQELYEELGREIDYDEFVIHIAEIHENLTNIVLLGKISKIFEVKSFFRKDGTSGKVGSFLLNDGTAEIKLILWDDNAEIIQNSYFRVGELLRVLNGYCKKNKNGTLEVHVGKKGRITLSPDDVDLKRFPHLQVAKLLEQNEEPLVKIKDLKDKNGFIEMIEGHIIKIVKFTEKRTQNNQIMFMLKFLLADETSSIAVIARGMQAIYCLKLIDENTALRLKKVVVGYNSYTKQKEIYFTKNTEIIIM